MMFCWFILNFLGCRYNWYWGFVFFELFLVVNIYQLFKVGLYWIENREVEKYKYQ